MNDIKVDIISRNPIKPSSPTPQTHKNFQLSLLDQLVPPIYAAAIFFYSNNEHSCPKPLSEISQSLQHSLSETLTLFYPLAGQIKGSHSIDCTDEGAYFFEARAHCDLSDDILSQPNLELLNRFLPTDKETIESCSGAVALIQLSGFDCGGVALSVCISHKMGDASTLCTFLKCWTAVARSGAAGEGDSPEFVGGSLMPPRELPAMPDMGVAVGKCITRRFVFDSSKITSLKNKITDPNAKKQPSRIESVLALILKCAISASRSISGSSTPPIFIQTVNLRSRMNPPLPENTVGNLVWQFPVFVEEGEEVELHELTDKMRKGMTDFCNEKANKFKGDEGFAEIMSSLAEWSVQFMTNKDIYRCSSWCRAPVYETDFGWGKPVWVSSASQDMRNIIVLVDTKDGEGIEAWLTLDEQEMALFEVNEELLQFACFNPSILI